MAARKAETFVVPRRAISRRASWRGLRLALLVCGLGLLLRSDFRVEAQDAARPPVDRDAVWRMIFARPEAIPAPPDNSSTPEKIALGAELFRDKRLSGAGNRACVSCHRPEHSFTDGLPRAEGLDGRLLRRNTLTLYDLAWGKSFYWDGRASTIEAQARIPLLHANEMAGDFAVIAERLSADRSMAARFAAAFPDSPQVSEATILKALGAYERSLIAPETRFDRWVKGEDAALSPQEKAGFAIFVGKGGCVACHGGWRFTDDRFHDIGLHDDDPGRGAVEGGVPGLAAFKTPTLRQLTHTAPYMHNGSMRSLDAVLDHYTGGLDKRPSLAANVVRDLKLSGEERRALVAFLQSLSGEP